MVFSKLGIIGKAVPKHKLMALLPPSELLFQFSLGSNSASTVQL